jgi:hypothetical protein
VDGSDRWQRSETVLWRLVLDDAVLLGPTSPDPFALAGGAGLWALLAEPRRVDELVAALSKGNDPTTEKELASLLKDLADFGAVERLPA